MNKIEQKTHLGWIIGIRFFLSFSCLSPPYITCEKRQHQIDKMLAENLSFSSFSSTRQVPLYQVSSFFSSLTFVFPHSLKRVEGQQVKRLSFYISERGQIPDEAWGSSRPVVDSCRLISCGSNRPH